MLQAAVSARQSTHTMRFRPARPIDVRRTLSILHRGRGDHTTMPTPTGMWRATRTPHGPGTQWVRNDGSDIVVYAWGPGAEWLVEKTPTLVGAHDCSDDFPDSHAELHELHRRFHKVRIPCTHAIWDSLFPVVLEQKVTGLEAGRSYRALQRAFHEPAPIASSGPALHLPPDPLAVAAAPAWVFHRAGVEAKRGDTIRRAAQYARHLQELIDQPIDAARAWLAKLPGIGEWTVAEIALVALGDADAVSVGDYHLKNTVSWALAGEPRGTDQRMLELLEPFRPHRGRVIRYLGLAGISAPRYGPRLTIQPRW